jgi:hypothetical protein
MVLHECLPRRDALLLLLLCWDGATVAGATLLGPLLASCERCEMRRGRWGRRSSGNGASTTGRGTKDGTATCEK